MTRLRRLPPALVRAGAQRNCCHAGRPVLHTNCDSAAPETGFPARRRRGISILELFLVMVIIFIVFTLFLSSGSKSGQEKRLAECQGQLQNIYAVMRTFSQDNNGSLPALSGAPTSEAPLSLLVPKYTTGTEFFICPGGQGGS